LITLELLYYEIHTRNRKHTMGLRASRKEKLCLVYLGWQEMNGTTVKLKDLKERKLDLPIQKLIKSKLIDHAFRPINEGRIFFFEIVYAVCKFWEKNKYHLTGGGLEVDVNEVKKIIA